MENQTVKENQRCTKSCISFIANNDVPYKEPLPKYVRISVSLPAEKKHDTVQDRDFDIFIPIFMPLKQSEYDINTKDIPAA